MAKRLTVDPANPIGDECHWNQRHAEGNWRLGYEGDREV